MESLVKGQIVQLLLAGIGMWQMVTGRLLEGIIILLSAIASEAFFQKSTIKKSIHKN